MKKIMFNDKYGLTKAVFEGRKTQTRRILNPTMLFERLNTYEGWTEEDIADWKESCKDRLYKADGEELKEMLGYALEHSPYKVGDKVSCSRCDVCWIKSIVPEKSCSGYTGKIVVIINHAKKDGTRSNREFVLLSMEIDSIKKID